MLARAIDPALRLHIERLRQTQQSFYTGIKCLLGALVLAAIAKAIPSPPLSLFINISGVALCVYFVYSGYTYVTAHFVCPECEGETSILEPWVCGTCSKEHKTLDILKGHTFITRCIREFCKNQTVAFACPHCLKTIQFYETKEPFRPAFHPDHPPPFKAPEPEPEPQLPTLGDLIPFAQRQTHTMIVGSTGSGKTEAMKQFIHSLLSQNVAGVVIDPHGDMAKEVAHWKNDRLIYLDPSLQKGHSPTINPFEIYGIDAADVSDDALAVKRVISQQLLSALQEITAAGERSEITKNMQTILNACILSLLDLQNATIRDLQRYMDDNRNIELVKFGSSRTHYPDVSEFFRHNFQNKQHLRLAKDAIFTKLQDLLTTGFFSDLTCGKSTINLQQAWNERKILVCNLGAGAIGERESAAFGRLLLNTLQGIAMRSADVDQQQRIPCHVFIDEAYMFVTPSIEKILRQARKYKLVLTLAAQQIGQMSKDLETTIRDSANVQLVGVTKPPNYKATASMFHLDENAIAQLRTGTFLARVGNNRPIWVNFSNELVGDKAAMPPYEWEQVKQYQIGKYYRPVQRALPEETDSTMTPAQAIAKAGPALAKIMAEQKTKPESKKRTLTVDDTEGDVI